MFDESASWYLPSPPTSDNYILISEDEVSEAEMPLDEGDIETIEESSISFRLSGPNERLSRYDQSDEEPASIPCSKSQGDGVRANRKER